MIYMFLLLSNRIYENFKNNLFLAAFPKKIIEFGLAVTYMVFRFVASYPNNIHFAIWSIFIYVLIIHVC